MPGALASERSRGRPSASLLACLALRSLRQSPGRSTLGLIVAALAVVLLMAGLSMGDVGRARAAHASDRSPLPGVAQASDNEVLFEKLDSYYGDRPISAQAVAVRGTSSLVPAGLRELPRPGELAVSPAMQELLVDPTTTMALRYPGRVAQLVSDAGLVGPHELVIWVGREADQMGPRAIAVRGFGGATDGSLNLPAELRPAQVLLIAGFLIPLIALLVTCTTIGDLQRRERMSALRLLGLTSRQTKLMTAVEAGGLAVAGVTLGLGGFWLARPFVPSTIPVNGGVWSADVPVGLGEAAGLIVLIPLIAVAASIAAMRTVTVSPLSVVRRVEATRPTTWRLLPLAVGALLIVAALVSEATGAPTSLSSLTVVLAVASCSLGLLLGGGVMTHHAAALVERFGGTGLPVLFGARQADASAVRSARGATGLACMLFVSGLLLSFFPLLSDASSSARARLVEAAGPSLLVVSLEESAPVDSGRLAEARTIDGFALLRQLPVRVQGSDEPASLLVADCEDLQAVLGLSVESCAEGLVLSGETRLPAGAAVQAIDMSVNDAGMVDISRNGPSFTLPTASAQTEQVSTLQNAYGLSSSLLMPLERLPPAVQSAIDDAQGLLVARAATGQLEAARTAISRAAPGATVLTTGESLAIAEKDTRTFRALTLVAFSSGLAVAALSLLVATVDQAQERRRAWQALWIIGASRRLWARSLYMQIAIGAVPILLIAFAFSLGGAFAFLNLADAPPPLPLVQMSATLAGALLAPLIAAVVVTRRSLESKTPNRDD